MFRSKNRGKSGKKVAKGEKQKSANSAKVCQQKTTITKTAGLTSKSNTSQCNPTTGDQHQQNSNSVQQYSTSQTISKHVFETSKGRSISASNGDISNGETLSRRTYSLEKVSRSLDEIMASGKAILDALSSVNSNDSGLKITEENTQGNASTIKSGVDSKKHDTYDVNEGSDLLEQSFNNGRSFGNSLEDLNKDLSFSSIQRNTYDLDSIATKLDENLETDASLEEILYELSLDTSQDDPKAKRSTYDLEKVSTTLDHSISPGKSTQDSFEQASVAEIDSDPNLNGESFDFGDVITDHNTDTSFSAQRSNHNTAQDIGQEQTGLVKRATYNLSNASDILDNSVNSGVSIDDSLNQISSSCPVELKRQTYDLTDLTLSERLVLENNNTMKAGEQQHTSMDKHNPHVLLNSENLSTDMSKHEKRNTYVIDDSIDLSSQAPSGDSSPEISKSLSEDGYHDKPVDGLLIELGLDWENSRSPETELTPNQWMKQMKGLTSSPTNSPLKLRLDSKKCRTDMDNVEGKTPKKSSDVTHVETKERSQTISNASSTSTELSSHSATQIRSRSMSDSTVKAQLMSSSSPSVSSSTPTSENISKSLEEISPGIRNYLANKLGLSEEQCIAVHRRLSTGSHTASDAAKLANHKTYSLDDVAHSLEIATTEGLPMTEVLDNLTQSEQDVRVNYQKVGNQKSDTESENTKSSADDSTNVRPETLDLKPNVAEKTKASTNRQTYIFVDESPTSKPTPLDNQFKLVCKKAVYKPSAKLHSFSHLLGGKGGQLPLRRARGSADPLKRNTYTLESVAESLEKAQDAGVTMLEALKRLSGSHQAAESVQSKENRKTYDLEDVSKTLETAVSAGMPIVDTLRNIVDPPGAVEGTDEVSETPKPQPKKKPPPKPKRTFSNSSKAEIKFVSDSFVVEYYTSPKKSQSTSSERSEENLYVNQSTVVAHSDLNETLVPHPTKEKSAERGISGNVASVSKNIEEQKPATKVVNDLDSLLVKLAAEVNKTNVDSPQREWKSASSESPGKRSSGEEEMETEEDAVLTSPPHDVSVQSSGNTSARTLEKDEIGLQEKLASDSASVDVVVSPEAAENVMDDTHIRTQDSEEIASNSVSEKPVGKKTGNSLNTPEDMRPELYCTEEVESSIVRLSSNDVKESKDSVSNNKTDILKVFLDDESSSSNTKADDEGYCSLSRKPARAMKVNDNSQLGADKFFEDEQQVALEDEPEEAVERVEIVCSYDTNGETQELEITFPAEDDGNESVPVPSTSPSKPDPVSRELNLLRLRLAEKQRDIEAQKQRTKEQLEEERKRFGQNVFWLAVGKGREKKDRNEINSPAKVMRHKQHFAATCSEEGKSQNLGSTAFTKHSSLDEELPPSMGKLQDRTYHLKTNDDLSMNDIRTTSIPEEKVLNENASPMSETFAQHLVEGRESSEDILQFRLSQQPPVGQDLNSNKMQSPSNGFPRNSDTEFVQNSEKSKMPALNYKSRMNVPVSYQTKPDSKNSPTDSENSSMTETSEKQGEVANGNLQDFTASCRDAPHSPESPKRKCWETAGFSGKPCTTVSDSNNQSAGQSDASAVITCQKQTENGNKFNRVDSEMHRMLESTSSNDTSQQPEVNLQTREGDDTPKKGLALFIGEENTPNYDGLTPEQVRKREKFLRHRQQKIEDDKAKKEALLEKRRRKDEKLKELGQLREIEEESRQTRLQEKREQVEMVKQEREKYEMQRRENLARTNFVDGTLGNHAGYTKAGGKTRGIPGGSSGHTKAVKTATTGSGAFEAQESVQANTPSAFSGFSGVQSYVRPSGKTNRKLIINAISHVCLPGAVNRETKEKCLQAMTESSAQHFIILFKEGLKFRGLYSLDLESNQVLKVHGIGPRAVTEKMIEQLYKYNSGGKEFLQIPAKGFSLSVDGFTLQKIYWQSNKPSVASKTSSNYKQTASKTWR